MSISELKITTEHIQRQDKEIITIFHLRGWLDSQSESTLIAAAQEEFSQGIRYLVVNLEEIQMLTSAGIRAVQKLHKLFESSNLDPATVRLKLCSAPQQVHHALALTGILQTIPMYESLQAVLISYNK